MTPFPNQLSPEYLPLVYFLRSGILSLLLHPSCRQHRVPSPVPSGGPVRVDGNGSPYSGGGPREESSPIRDHVKGVENVSGNQMRQPRLRMALTALAGAQSTLSAAPPRGPSHKVSRKEKYQAAFMVAKWKATTEAEAKKASLDHGNWSRFKFVLAPQAGQGIRYSSVTTSTNGGDIEKLIISQWG